jgi:hypothetical protein
MQGGLFPNSTMDPYEPYQDYYTGDKLVTPIYNAPEPKSRFVPSKHEHIAVMKLVRAIRAVRRLLYVCMSGCMSGWMFCRRSVYLSLYVSFDPSVYLSLSISIYPSLSVFLSIYGLSVLMFSGQAEAKGEEARTAILRHLERCR